MKKAGAPCAGWFISISIIGMYWPGASGGKCKCQLAGATECWTKLVELADAAEFSAAATGLALGVGLDRVGTAMSVFCASAAM
jgi:hypothetical protein